jgi:hypothetical protein
MLTMDNGFDHTKPNTFGEAALRSLPPRSTSSRPRATSRGCCSPASRSSSPSAPTLDSFVGDAEAFARRGGQEGHAPSCAPGAAVPDGGGDQRRLHGRRARDRAALRLPDAVDGAPRSPSPRCSCRSSRPGAARSSPRRSGGEGDRDDRHQRAEQQQVMKPEGGLRARVTPTATHRLGRLPRRLHRLPRAARHGEETIDRDVDPPQASTRRWPTHAAFVDRTRSTGRPAGAVRSRST